MRTLRSLEFLNVTYSASFGDNDLQVVGELNKLEVLILSNTSVGAEGLAHLAPLTSLKQLWLSALNVGDDSVVHILKLTSLNSLNVRGTKMTKEGVERIRAGLPNLVIG